MNLRTTILLFSLLPSTAAIEIDVDNIKHDDTNHIRGVVPSPSSINNNIPTLLVSGATVNRRLGKPTGCKKNCPSPTTTTIATITPPPTCPPVTPDQQCTSDDGGDRQCYIDNSIICGYWRTCSGSCLPTQDACKSCSNTDRYRCSPSDVSSRKSVFADTSVGTVREPGSTWACYDGYGGYYGGNGYCGSLFGGHCCAKGFAHADTGICHPVVTTSVSTTTQATTVGSSTTTIQTTTTTAVTDPTTANAQCAEENEYCKGKDSKPCCPALTCDRDKKCH